MIPKPLTIAIVAACPFPWPRGTPIRAYRIAESLARNGHDVHVITYHLGERVPYPFTVHRIDNIPGYRKTSAGPSVGKLTRLNPALSRLGRELSRKIRFDVVHAIHLEGLLVAARAFPGLPIVYDAHTSLAGELPDYFPRLPRGLVTRAGAYLDRRIPVRADITIAVSERLREVLVETKAVEESRIVVIPNGVNTELFGRQPADSFDSDEIIYTGNDANHQRLDLLLEAFRRLIDIRPGAKLKLVGSSSFAKQRAFVDKSSLRQAVTICTVGFQEELRHLAGAAVAVSPRTSCDGMPQKILNYMAAGKAVVACAGSSASVRDGDTGVVVADDDPAAMASACLGLIDDPSRAQSIGRRARRYVRENHRWSSVASQIERAYEQCIDRKQSMN